MNLTVLVTDYTWDSLDRETDVLREVSATIVAARTGQEDELKELVPQADAILTCFARVSGDVIRAGSHLKVIGRYGIGVDNIAVQVATELGIPVTNVPVYCLDEVAEHALALILSLARNIARYDQHVHAGDWSLKGPRPLERIRGATLGIVGFGKIGQTLAAKASGLGLNVLTHDPCPDQSVLESLSATSVPLGELLMRSDFVSLHAPLTESTMNLIDADALHLMKSTAFLINTARGGLIDHKALANALQRGELAGAGLDVFEPERLPPDHPLLGLSNVVLTPHVAFYSEQSVETLQIRAARNVAAILAGRLPHSIVNSEVLNLARWNHLRPQG